MTRTTAIVVGLGAMGSATVRALAAAGVDVVGIDRHHPPHDRGSTHGETRVTRLACAEGPQYVPLAIRSHELWRELEARTGETLLHEVGTLMISRAGSPFLESVRAVAARFGLPGETLDATALRQRFPMFAVADDEGGFLDPGGGWLRPEATVAAQLACAAQDGARLELGATVRAWVWDVSPGAPGEPVDASHTRGFYGLPALDGPDGGLKLATEQAAHEHPPDGRQHPASAAQTADIYRRLVRDRLPWLAPETQRTVSCPYTCTVDGHFVIDRHPEHPAVQVVSACSGHGFKHSPAIGEAVAERVAGRVPIVDLSPFALDG